MNQFTVTTYEGSREHLLRELAMLEKISGKADGVLASVANFASHLFLRVPSLLVKQMRVKRAAGKQVATGFLTKPDACKNQTTFREFLFVENALEEIIGSICETIVSRGNNVSIVQRSNHLVPVNKKAFGTVFRNLLLFLNERNHDQQISLEVFENEDYIVIVAEHKGLPLLHPELVNIYRTGPAHCMDYGTMLVYSCWHILRVAGGWLTTGNRPMGVNYISVGLPK